MTSLPRHLLTMAAVIVAAIAHGQRHRLMLTTADTLPARWLRPIELSAADAVPRALSEQLAFLHGKGYLEASIDSLSLIHISEPTRPY